MPAAGPPFNPDSLLVAEVRPSPNHGPRPETARIDMLLLHYTGMAGAADALARLCDPRSEVSAHYLVFEDGRVVQLVAEERRAWHAGVGAWAGERDINSCSIGIEIANPGHDGGLPPYPAAQIEAVILLSRDILHRNAIPPERVLGHSDVAPARKEDPGELFPWQTLHAEGIGRWVPAAPCNADAKRLARASGVEALQSALARYGYALATTGLYDEATAATVRAFQRHFRQSCVDGIADASTVATLEALLRSLTDPA